MNDKRDRGKAWTIAGVLSLALGGEALAVDPLERAVIMDTLDEETMVVYEPAAPVRREVTVFTRLDCPYCKVLHQNIDKYLADGIRVRYVGWVSREKRPETYRQMVNVWCADDRATAMTAAKAGETLPDRDCDHPLEEHHRVAEQIGINGIPTLLVTSMEMKSGSKRIARTLRKMGR